jgi:2-polyprenyl-6-hydroxyphenyl methylase/3-demethylubiquinone-9 3-methyltransferase
MRHLITRLNNAVRTRILKRWGTTTTKRAIWDSEFAKGQWNYLESTNEDPIYRYLDKYAQAGAILDMGCGSGNTGNELDFSKYGSYTGVDISQVAIDKAKARTRANGRELKNEYTCGDIETYVPNKRYDVILFRESLFYVTRARIKGVLDRYSRHLKENGCVIVRLCNREKYAFIIELIERRYHVLDRHLVEQESGKDIVILFRPFDTSSDGDPKTLASVFAVSIFA